MPRLRRFFARRWWNACTSRFSVGLLTVLLWSSLLGWGLAQTTILTPPSEVDPAGTVDVVTDRYRLGQQFYLENCATCHVGLPPAVMPSQTWADLLQDNQHYGVEIQPLITPTLQIVWSYVSTYSRPIIQRERVPYRLSQSRYFKALHPKVEFAEPVAVNGCITCHVNARQYDYRTLAPEWQDAS
ncbi:MAG: diheme cytochrome C [Cyanobacteria bacterium RM1_2_2]|nr:diheme cytochrome C [Cyanobacteria bacterium RM1_2_2]